MIVSLTRSGSRRRRSARGAVQSQPGLYELGVGVRVVRRTEDEGGQQAEAFVPSLRPVVTQC